MVLMYPLWYVEIETINYGTIDAIMNEYSWTIGAMHLVKVMVWANQYGMTNQLCHNSGKPIIEFPTSSQCA